MTKGTRIYLAPERIDSRLSPSGYGIRSDMWALGLSAIEIAANRHPFYEKNEVVILATTVQVPTWTPEIPSNLSPELGELIISLLKAQQGDRPANYDEILTSSAMRSLPTEITDGETEMVKKVIEYIPKTLDK